MWGVNIVNHVSQVLTEEDHVDDEDSEDSQKDHVPPPITVKDVNIEEELNRLRAENTDLNSRLSAMKLFSTMLQKKEEEIEMVKIQLDKEIRKNDELRRRKGISEEINVELEKLRKGAETLKEKNAALLEKRQIDNEAMLKMKAELEQLRQQNVQLLQQTSENSKEDVNKKGNNDESTQQLEKLRQELQISREQEKVTREELSKAREELTRLRNHMLKSEKDNEEAIIDLKNKLEMATSLLDQKEQMIGEKNIFDLYEQQKAELISVTQQLEEKTKELDNLQSVVDQWSYDQSQEIEMRTLHLSKEIKSQAEKISEYENKLNEFQDISEQNKSLKVDLENLREMLEIKTRAFEMLQKEYQPLKSTLDQTLKKLNYELKNNQDVIDKQIVTALIVTYFSSTTKKQDVLEVMAGILNFSEDNKAKIGLPTSHLSNKRGWLSGWFSSGTTSSTTTTSITTTTTTPSCEIPDFMEGKNFADLWIEFLLHEAENEKNSFESVVTHNNSENK